MLTATRLFYKRLRAEWNFQYRVIRMAADWTVLLYLVLPALLFLAYYYFLWWKDTPNWFGLIPFPAILIGLFIWSWSGTFRIFLEEADQIFLLQREKWVGSLIKGSIGYSLIKYGILAVFLVMVAAPYLLFQLHFTISQFMLLILTAFLWKNCMLLSKQLFFSHYQGWKRIILLFFTLVISFLGFVTVNTLITSNLYVPLAENIVLIFVLLTFIRMRLNLKGSFFDDIAREQEQRMKYAALLFRAGGITNNQSSKGRKVPRLFSKSNLLFRKRTPVNGLTEAVIKSFLRNGTYVSNYIRLLSVFSAGVILVPVSIKWIISFAYPFLLALWLRGIWEEIESNHFLRLFRWKQNDKTASAQKSVFILILPGMFLIGFLTGYLTGSWLGALLSIPVVPVIGNFIVKILLLNVKMHKGKESTAP